MKKTDDLWDAVREIAHAKRDLRGMQGGGGSVDNKCRCGSSKVKSCPALDSEQPLIETGLKPVCFGFREQKQTEHCGRGMLVWDLSLSHADKN